MKTLADFKRALTVGSLWRITWPGGDSTVRPVHKVQSNGVYFALPDGRNSFLDFPKAADFEINGKGQVEIYRPGSLDPNFQYERKLILSYEKV